MERSSASSLSRAIPPAYGQSDRPDLPTSKSSSGPTVKKDRGLLAGLAMSRAAAWVTEVKSIEMSGAGILCSAAIFAAILGTAFGMRLERSRNDSFRLNEVRYKMVGIAQLPGVSEKVFVPVYKEAQ